MRRLHDWLDEYSASHENRANKLLHWICIPAIIFSLLGLLWDLPFPAAVTPPWLLNWAVLLTAAAGIYYSLLSPRLTMGMLPALMLMLAALHALDRAPLPLDLWLLCMPLFAAAWAGQFIGHMLEGKRPSFFKDLQFLLIGPLWLLAAAYRRAGIPY